MTRESHYDHERECFVQLRLLFNDVFFAFFSIILMARYLESLGLEDGQIT
jgi:hypothetical protein